ncbi:hypothetical protein CLRAG_33730 [Clostridium ragsdalei P11]|uniref:Uncharacterized protein n=1 Tax=Clostridium ragsdalei P11 TaxID=1353534 RepID=A0A1A6AKW4_9CLOT|nr:hypothetical protein [Clostridium ragsdalei]OBR90725.1 hypothetical protein CLRAG_33730 [Clostridium ragsdalei P11]
MLKDNGRVKMAMSHFKEELLKAVEKMIEEKRKRIDYCRTVYGIVRQCNIDGTYDVEINSCTQKIYSMDNAKYSVGNVVVCLVLDNRNYSNKIILCKKPTVI